VAGAGPRSSLPSQKAPLTYKDSLRGWPRLRAAAGTDSVSIAPTDGHMRLSRPLAHIWVSEKAPWFEITDDLPRSERGGEELEAALKSPPTSGQSPG